MKKPTAQAIEKYHAYKNTIRYRNLDSQIQKAVKGQCMDVSVAILSNLSKQAADERCSQLQTFEEESAMVEQAVLESAYSVSTPNDVFNALDSTFLNPFLQIGHQLVLNTRNANRKKGHKAVQKEDKMPKTQRHKSPIITSPGIKCLVNIIVILMFY